MAEPTFPSARAQLVAQIADIIREFEEPDGSEEYPAEAAERIIALVLAALAPPGSRLQPEPRKE